VQGAASYRLVNPANELTVLRSNPVAISVGDRRAQPARERLHRGRVAEVLEPLRAGGPDTLFLLFDVRHT
jgi:hypothetical protein